MTSITPYLKKMDQEIMRLRQEIAVRQLEIHKIEESRLTIMGIEQRTSGEPESPMSSGLLNGTSYDQRAALVVRHAGGDDHFGGEDGTASRAAKPGLNKSGNRRGLNQTHKSNKRKSVSEQGHYREKVLALLAGADEPMTSKEMANHLGLPASADARKPLQNAIYQMRVNDVLHRDPDKRYSLPKLSRPAASQ